MTSVPAAGRDRRHAGTGTHVPDRFRERQWTRLPARRGAGGICRAGSTTAHRPNRTPRSTTPVPAQSSAPAAEAGTGATRDSGLRYFRSSTAAANSVLTALAAGLSEDIVTGLSRFSYLRVIARGSTQRYAGDALDSDPQVRSSARVTSWREPFARRGRGCVSPCSSSTRRPAPISGPRLRSFLQPRSGVRVAGRSRAPDRLNGRRRTGPPRT